MKSFVIFLNELSCASAGAMLPEDMLEHVLSMLATVRDAKRIRDDIIVVGHVPLSAVTLGDGAHFLAEVLRGDTYKDEWRFLRSLDQSSPWAAYPGSTVPGDFQEVMFQGEAAVGMLWAKQNDSAIVSFGFPPNWTNSQVPARFHELDGVGNIASTDIVIPNLSLREHVTIHRPLIDNYGRAMAASSLVYEAEGFVVRMFFNDHNPPHFHILKRSDASETLARYAIETLDLMSGALPTGIRKRVEKWAENRRDDLMRNWERCRNGQHPFTLGD